MIEFDDVRDYYVRVTARKKPHADVFEDYFDVAKEQSETDEIKPENTQKLYICYYIAYLDSVTDLGSGAVTAKSQTVGSSSISVSPIRGSETLNQWLARCNQLKASCAQNKGCGGGITSNPLPEFGYRDDWSEMTFRKQWRS